MQGTNLNKWVNMRNNRDLDRFLDVGLDLTSRTIFLTGDIDSDSTDRFIKNFYALETNKVEAPIYIVLNSPGGDWYNGLAVYDTIKQSKAPVTIRVTGMAMSMASVILQAGDKRLLSGNCTVMIHAGCNSFDGHAPNLIKAGEEEKRCLRLMEDIYLSSIRGKHPKFTRPKLQKMLALDTYMSAHQAIELGLADAIIS